MLLERRILHDERRRFIVFIAVVDFLALLNISDFGIVPHKVFIRLDVHDMYVVVVIFAVWLVLVCLKQLEAAFRAAGASPRLPVPFYFNLVNVPGLIL